MSYNCAQFYSEFFQTLRCIIFFKHISRFYRKLFQPEAPKRHVIQTSDASSVNLTIIPRKKHTISRQAISPNALKVLYRLNKHGYEAYLVGGCVRDLLLNKQPKDFDITTNATPEQLQKIFRNCRLVGRRFKLAHILFGREVIEVATFRGIPIENENSQLARQSKNGMLLRDNVYGTIDQDAQRRDFTINSLYYDINDFTVRDYCNGLYDLRLGIIKLIGDPEIRYREDPVRMLRAIRFAAKLNMTIDANSAKPIKELKSLLRHIPAPRLFDESIKLFHSGHGHQTYLLLREHELFGELFPVIDKLLSPYKGQKPQSHLEKMLEQVLKNTDYRLTQQKRNNPAFMFAAFLWYPLNELTQNFVQESGLTYHDAFSMACDEILREQCRSIAIPRRLTTIMQEIWQLQIRMSKRFSKRAQMVFNHPKFRAGYDLLELRASIEKGELLVHAKWWDEFQFADGETRKIMIQKLPQPPKHRRPNKAKKRASPTDDSKSE